MTALFDLDNTLLDNESFKAALASAFGVGLRDFNRSYEQHFTRPGRNYTIGAHVGFLTGEGLINPSSARGARSRARAVMSRIRDFVFPEMEELVRLLKERGDRLWLITKGDIGFQAMKISHWPELKEYFDRIHITDRKKAGWLRGHEEIKKELAGGGDRVMIINDRAGESLELKNELGRAEIALVKSRHSANQDNLPEYDLKAPGAKSARDIRRLYDQFGLKYKGRPRR